ncbi:MAG TPA: AzlD domain-containing protein [Streptosporangiaceae bacterium]|nr:AzlD domain-containing protein [Streptosporangiaceae bacterium]
MSRTWLAIAAVSVLSFVLKAAVPMISRGRRLNQRALAVVALMPVALLTAFVLTETVTTGQHLALDSRLGGLAAAGIALRLRAPLIVVVIVAAAVTAAIRVIA